MHWSSLKEDVFAIKWGVFGSNNSLETRKNQSFIQRQSREKSDDKITAYIVEFFFNEIYS